MKTSQAGIDLIKRFEGLRLEAYKCLGGIWTIGYGTTHYPDGSKVKEGDTCTEEQAEEYLRSDLEEFERCVSLAVRDPLTQHQFDALVSFVYNVGCGAFRKSTLLRMLNDGADMSAAEQFLRWNKVGAQEVKGLTLRRQAEMELFLT